MYLVRAMQLAPLAQSLTSYSMSFADTASISAALKPYVYLLNMYGIVRGDQANRFLPNGDLTGPRWLPCSAGPLTLWRSGASMPSCPPIPAMTGWAAPLPPLPPAAAAWSC